VDESSTTPSRDALPILEEGLLYKIQNSKRHYATNRKVAGSRPDEVNDLSVCLILPTAIGPGVYSASTRKSFRRRKMFLRRKAAAGA
jgi:hypothetical protein